MKEFLICSLNNALVGFLVSFVLLMLLGSLRKNFWSKLAAMGKGSMIGGFLGATFWAVLEMAVL